MKDDREEEGGGVISIKMEKTCVVGEGRETKWSRFRGVKQEMLNSETGNNKMG